MENYFASFPETARVWIYQADRAFTPYEEQSLTPALKQFASQWTAHKQALRADAAVLNSYFIVLVVDEDIHDASGCSIDSSVKFIKEIGAQLNIDFFNRLNAVVEMQNQFHLLSPKELQHKVESGLVHPQTAVFNNLVNTLGELRAEWLAPIETTWMKRYFNGVKA
jgi:hypothetical protein